MNVRRNSLILALGLLTVGGAAWAVPSLSLAFTSDTKQIDLYATNTVTFTGTITNTSVSETLSFDSAFAQFLYYETNTVPVWAMNQENTIIDYTALYSVPDLAPADVYIGNIFTVTLAGVTPQTATLHGQFTVSMYPLPDGVAVPSAPVEFFVDVIPEPASLALLGLGLLALVRRPRKVLR